MLQCFKTFCRYLLALVFFLVALAMVIYAGLEGWPTVAADLPGSNPIVEPDGDLAVPAMLLTGALPYFVLSIKLAASGGLRKYKPRDDEDLRSCIEVAIWECGGKGFSARYEAVAPLVMERHGTSEKEIENALWKMVDDGRLITAPEVQNDNWRVVRLSLVLNEKEVGVYVI